MSARSALRDENGASLVIALAFVTFMGVFSVAILAFTGVGATTTSIVDARSAQRYAADAGMEHGIANLVADASACRLPGSTRTWPSLTVNAHAVTYSCAAPPALLGPYGTIVTGTGGIEVSGVNGLKLGVRIQYVASLHAAGPITFGTPAMQSSFVNGDVTVAGTCPVANVTIAPAHSCSADASVPALSALSVHVPTAAAAAPTTEGTCTTLYPGRYGAGGLPIPSFDRRKSYYLASGVYYLDGETMTLQGSVFGGQPAPGESRSMTESAPCRATDPPDTGYSGSGVTFVLGGAGALRVQNADSRVELFARVPGGLDAGATPWLGVWAGRGSSVLDGGSSYADTTSPEPIIATDSAATNVVVHGAVHVPTAGTSMLVHDNALAGGSPVFPGGLVTSRLQITAAKGDDGKTMTVAGSIPTRSPVLTATVPGLSGAPTVRASATIRPDGTPLVSDWRVV